MSNPIPPDPTPIDPFCSSCRLLLEDCSCFPDEDEDDFEEEDPFDIDHLGFKVKPEDESIDEDELL